MSPETFREPPLHRQAVRRHSGANGNVFSHSMELIKIAVINADAENSVAEMTSFGIRWEKAVKVLCCRIWTKTGRRRRCLVCGKQWEQAMTRKVQANRSLLHSLLRDSSIRFGRERTLRTQRIRRAALHGEQLLEAIIRIHLALQCGVELQP